MVVQQSCGIECHKVGLGPLFDVIRDGGVAHRDCLAEEQFGGDLESGGPFRRYTCCFRRPGWHAE